MSKRHRYEECDSCLDCLDCGMPLRTALDIAVRTDRKVPCVPPPSRSRSRRHKHVAPAQNESLYVPSWAKPLSARIPKRA